MGDDNHRHPFVPERAKDSEELIGLLRCQDTCRLIQYQYLGSPIECLDGLYPLLLTHRYLINARFEVYMQSELLLEPLYLSRSISDTSREHHAALRPENNILKHGEVLYKHKMLMHHPYSGSYSIGRISNPRRYVIDINLTAVCFVKAIENAHECGFAGTILADNSVDRTGRYDEINIPVCLYCAKGLRDTPQVDGGWARGSVFHRLSSMETVLISTTVV